MGANAQTSVPTFTAGEILTAANMNISARTGIPVFATTVTRDAAFGGTGEKTLAEGQFAYLEDSNTTQYYDGAAWQSVGITPGSTLISATTVGTAVASVTVSNAFSATYDNYQIIYSGGVGSTGANLGITLGATTAGYYSSISFVTYATNVLGTASTNNGASWSFVGDANTGYAHLICTLLRPFATDETVLISQYGGSLNTGVGGGYLNNTTSYTAFTITPNAGTLTGGTIRVYGLQNS